MDDFSLLYFGLRHALLSFAQVYIFEFEKQSFASLECTKIIQSNNNKFELKQLFLIGQYGRSSSLY